MSELDKVERPGADECCAPAPIVLPPKVASDRAALVREAFRMEWLTLAWVAIEAVVGTVAGIAAGSLVLMRSVLTA